VPAVLVVEGCDPLEHRRRELHWCPAWCGRGITPSSAATYLDGATGTTLILMSGRLIPTVIVALLLSVTGAVGAAAAPPSALDRRTGIDISWPQCGKGLPSGMAYAIVGVNGGTAATTNKCLSTQLAWASSETTGANPNQPRIQLYVNTANPGEALEEYQVTTWPTDNVDGRQRDSYENADEALRNPYGHCSTTAGNYRGYTNDVACSWQYGWNRAVEAVDLRFTPAARAAGLNEDAAAYRWWLDVETMNSWQQAGTPQAFARNTASLEGMMHFFAAEGVTKVGLYSTSYQWGQIVGNTLSIPTAANPATGANLKDLDSWLAGASNATEARKRCITHRGLTGGPVVLNQYIVRNLDHNYSCS
jgi:hypothetical protein